MSFITLDFETSYSTGKHAPKYSLGNLTYEEYINDEHFLVCGVGIKINDGESQWYSVLEDDLKSVLESHFPPGNSHTMLCHNTAFDAAILNWHYGLQANEYLCSMMMSDGLWRFESASLKRLAMRLWPNDETKRKGSELMVTDGVIALEEYTKEMLDYIGGYCKNDCDLTFDAFKEMYPVYPEEELSIIDDTIKMFTHRPLVLDRQLVLDYKAELLKERKRTIEASGVAESTLASTTKFAKYLLDKHGIEVKKVPSPTVKNPKNMKYPFSKKDLAFVHMMRDYPELQHIWDGRIAAASNQEKTRCDRFLTHGAITPNNPNGNIAIPLKYCGANTTRFSGTNSINMQNLGRKSKLRNGLVAPDGQHLIIADQKNIEGYMNAAFNKADWKLDAYASGVDFYNKLASEVFDKPVDRHHPDQEAEGALGKVGELGLGYGMGENKFQLTCQTGPMGMPPMPWVNHEISHRTVMTWRTSNPEIVNGWHMADAMLERIADPSVKPFVWNDMVTVRYQGIILPSGLAIQYPRLKYDVSNFPNPDGSDNWGWMYWNGKFWKDIWGGTVIENIVQGIARVSMTEAQSRIKKRIGHLGVMLVLTVHDELVYTCPDEHLELAKQVIEEELTRTPEWCKNRPIQLGCKINISKFYLKD